MEYNRNFFIAIGLSLLLIIAWQWFWVGPSLEAQKQAQQIEQQIKAQEAKNPVQANDAGQSTINAANKAQIDMTVQSRRAAVGSGERIKINTPSIEGSINLTGAQFDDLFLRKYRLTVDPDSQEIPLLNPFDFKQGYLANFGFEGNKAFGDLPQFTTKWRVEGNDTLTPENPVTLVYENDKGLSFRRVVSVDSEYMFTITDSVSNESGVPVTLYPYGLVRRASAPEHIAGGMLLHEGMIAAVANENIVTKTYSDLAKLSDGKTTHKEALNAGVGGWVGITDKYWAVTAIPDQNTKFDGQFLYSKTGQGEAYNAYFRREAVTIENHDKVTVTNKLFAGAKRVELLNQYEETDKIDRFSLLIDWGLFRIITKPMFSLIDFLYKFTGNFGVAILLATVVLKLLLFPLANKSYKSMARMKLVQPKVLEIREKYGDDRQKQQMAMMELYKTEKINPLAGCWPMFIQMPIFFALYKVLYITLEMRHAPFFGWIKDLAAPDPTSVFNLFGLFDYSVPSFLMLGAWPLIMGVTMFLQMRMNPTPADPTQAMIFTWMPVVFTFTLASFPAGLVIYWTWNNLLSILQQGMIMKGQGVKIELWDNVKGLFKRKPKKEAK